MKEPPPRRLEVARSGAVREGGGRGRSEQRPTRAARRRCAAASAACRQPEQRLGPRAERPMPSGRGRASVGPHPPDPSLALAHLRRVAEVAAPVAHVRGRESVERDASLREENKQSLWRREPGAAGARSRVPPSWPAGVVAPLLTSWLASQGVAPGTERGEGVFSHRGVQLPSTRAMQTVDRRLRPEHHVARAGRRLGHKRAAAWVRG